MQFINKHQVTDFCFFKKYVQRPRLLRGKKQAGKGTLKAQTFPGSPRAGRMESSRETGASRTSGHRPALALAASLQQSGIPASAGDRRETRPRPGHTFEGAEYSNHQTLRLEQRFQKSNSALASRYRTSTFPSHSGASARSG